MLTTSAHSQYLHPDYLQPLPTTLDAKKSPLALLAQTCSSIGKDTTPSKSLIPPLEKSKDGKSSRASPNTTSSSSSSKSDGDSAGSDKARSKSPGEKGGDPKDGPRSPGSDSSKSSFRAPPPKDIPPLVPIAHSPGAQRKGSSTPETGGKDTARDQDNASTGSGHGGNGGGSTGRSSAGLNSNSRISLSCGNMLLEVNHHESASAAAKLSSSSSSSSASGSGPTLLSSASVAAMSSSSSLVSSSSGLTSSVPMSATLAASSMLKGPLDGLHSPHPGMLAPMFSAYAGCLPLGLGGAHPSDAASMHAAAAHSAALSAHSAMTAAAAKHSAHAALSPYTYARVKTTSGATTLVPICRDPYCTNCQITMQHSALTSGATCAAGCTQCTHEKTLPTPLPPSSVASALGAGGLGPSVLSGLGASPSSLYPHAFGVLPGHHTMPYVCNWVAGADYCGKRFTTSEELLQHLRTHTAGSDTAASLAAMQYPGLPGLSSMSPLTAAGCHSHYGGAGGTPGSLSPNSLRQAYGRMSPNTLLAASRYHPYSKSPLSGLPTASPAALQGLPGAPSAAALGAYYSPYAALYGQRLGAVP